MVDCEALLAELPGALLEQVAVALTQKNPSAFVDGDPSRIVIGQSLSAPLSDEVFAIDPMEAFRAVHGASAAVPGPTQNLIDAQHRSREAAGETAAAQIAALSRGESVEQVAESGRKALDAWESNQKKAAAAGAPTAASECSRLKPLPLFMKPLSQRRQPNPQPRPQPKLIRRRPSPFRRPRQLRPIRVLRPATTETDSKTEVAASSPTRIGAC